MNDWLVKLAEQQPTDEEQLMSALEGMSVEDLQELASYEEPQTENLDSFEEKMAAADQMGRELAHRYGDDLEKVAVLPLLGLAAKGIAGLAGRALAGKAVKGIAGQVAGNAIGGMMGGGGGGGMRPAAGTGYGGGFKYASKEKQAFIGGLLRGAGGAAAKGAAKPSMLGGLAKNMATDMAIGKGMEMLSGGGRAAAPAAHAAPAAMQGGGGFSYGTGKFASVRDIYVSALEKNAAGWAQSLAKHVGGSEGGNKFLRGAAAKMMRNPAAATAMAGAALGAAKGLVSDPGVDPMTGMPRSRLGAMARGAAVGGGLGYAGGKFIPGAGSAVQGLGKDLSGALRAIPKPGGGAAPAAAAAALPTAKVVSGGGAPSAMQQVLHADPSTTGVTQHGAQQVASEVAKSGQGPLSKMKNMLMGQRGINVPVELQAPGSVKLAFMSPVDRIKLAMLSKQGSAIGTAGKQLFSTKISPAAAGQAVRSGMGGAFGAARQTAKPPPIPAAARQQPGLAGVQRQLNSAQSVAGGGMPGMRPATITAMPGSGW